MSGLMPELLRSLDLQPMVEKIGEGAVLDFVEYSLLRESADAKLYHLLAKVCSASQRAEASNRQGEENLRKLQEACLRVTHLLQASCLALRRLQLDHQDQRLAREALESQLAYMQACLQRSLVSFDSSA
ncbi:hypothetical protein [Pseudomonas sp. NPDC089396]|uniref:hypothetical protein n=1 Tax=Pseudomonas sp. NPDC089396 TaxID=3364461 RepID=UPI0038392421